MTADDRELLILVIGQHIRELRKKYGLSQFALGHAVGSQSMVSLIENGKIVPTPDTLRAISLKYNDETLNKYADYLENGSLSLNSLIESKEALIALLENQRGSWQPAHNRIASSLCHDLYHAGEYQRLQELCNLIINRANTESLIAESHFYLGSSMLYEYKYSDAETELKLAESMMDYLPQRLRPWLLYSLGYVCLLLNMQASALHYAFNAVNQFRREYNFSGLSRALGLLGAVQVELGLSMEGKNTALRALELSKNVELDLNHHGCILGIIAQASLNLGELEEAEDYALRGRNLAQITKDDACLADADRILVEIYRAQGKLDEANVYLLEGLRIAEDGIDRITFVRLSLLQAELAEDINIKIEAARLAYELTRNTINYTLHALSAEFMTTLLSSVNAPNDEIQVYKESALNAYRNHTVSNATFSDTAKGWVRLSQTVNDNHQSSK